MLFICIEKPVVPKRNHKTILPHAILGNNYVAHQGALVQVCRSKWYNDFPVTPVKREKRNASIPLLFFFNNFH